MSPNPTRRRLAALSIFLVAIASIGLSASAIAQTGKNDKNPVCKGGGCRPSSSPVPTPSPSPSPAATGSPGPSPSSSIAPSPSGTPTSPSPSAPPSSGYTPPTSIPSDCSIDVTAELQSWIATVPDNSTISFPANACYRIDQTLSVVGRWGLTFEGNGVTFKAVTQGDESRRHLKFRDGGDLTIRDMIVIGANPNAGMGDSAWNANFAAQHAYSFYGVQGAVLDQVQAYDVYGDFVYIGANANLIPSRNIQVLNSTFDRNGRQGISVTGAEHVLIKNNTIADVRMCVIDLEPMSSDWYVNDVQIVGNTLGPRRITLLSASSQGDVDKVTLADNAVVGTLRLVIEAKNSAFRYSGFSLTGNTASTTVNSGGPSMGFTRVDNVYLSGNTIVFKPGSGSDLMALENSAHVLVENNDLTGVDNFFNLRDSLSYDYVARNNKI